MPNQHANKTHCKRGHEFTPENTKVNGRGARLCQQCYQIDLASRPRAVRPTLSERFWAKVEKGDACWIWGAVRNEDGYGQFKYDGHMEGAHRVAFRLAKGEIPAGFEILHSCDNPACVRPTHLALGTHAQNMQDAARKGRIRTPQTGKTHCKNGHEYTPENTYLLPNGRHRQCKICRQAHRSAKSHRNL